MTLFEMIKTRPYEMQQEFSCGVRKQNENEVLVSVWRPKAKKCQLAVIAEGKRKLFPMYPAKMCGMEDYLQLSYKRRIWQTGFRECLIFCSRW